MPLGPGERVGTYEIVAPLGAGGMGDVYRARDTRLGRQVAIKVLPDAFAADPDRLKRFEREAHLLASLSHPHIGAIYGFEEAGGTGALVLELVEGPTLADLIAHGHGTPEAESPRSGPRDKKGSGIASLAGEQRRGASRGLGLDEALRFARQIADALAAAHEQGIVHRDLKPANIKVRPDGVVKVLDFGLAKALTPDQTGGGDLTQSPTLSAVATRAGIILGTAAYMAPEQAKGRQVDKRADIWAFGCVLYEMLTGKRAFQGQDVAETLAFVITKPPDWQALPFDTPVAVQRLLRRALEKDPTRRLRDIGDAQLEMEEALVAPDAQSSPAQLSSLLRQRRAWLAGISGLLVGVALAGLGLWLATRGPETTAPVQRLSMTFPPDAAIVPLRGLALSRDGTRLAYVGAQESERGPMAGRIYVRELADREPRALPGTQEAFNPFFSPDGEWVGFFTGANVGGYARPGQLKKVAVRGGVPITLADAVLLGGSWGDDDSIVFSAATDGGFGLYRIAASGGEPEPLTRPATGSGQVRHARPHHVPGTDTVIYSVTDQPTFETGRVAALSLRTGESRTIVEQGYHAMYAASGHLVYALNGNLMALPFDIQRLQPSGVAATVVERVRAAPLSGLPDVAVSTDGLLVYASATDPGVRDTALEWVGRDGLATAITPDRAGYSYPRVALDGRWLAVGIDDDVWVFDLQRGRRTRLTAGDRGADPSPPITAWTPDGFVTFNRRGTPQVSIELIGPDGGEQRPPLLARPHLLVPSSWSRDGRTLAFFEFPGGSARDLWVLEPGADAEPRPFLVTRFNERAPAISPDGGWIAYASDASGRDEVYVRPYPGPGGQIPISTDGGAEPVWSSDGRELFYRTEGRMMVVAVDPGTSRPRSASPVCCSNLSIRTGASECRTTMSHPTASGSSWCRSRSSRRGVVS